MTTLDSIERAIADIAAGKPVVVVDDADRENEGDLIFAAEKVTAELIAFMMTSCRGLICVPMAATDLERLDIGDMVEHNTESQRTAFTVSVDAAEGVTTGISAADRARTIAVLNDPVSEPKDLVRPGHIFPLRANRGGVLQRAGHTEAAVDLARLAGLRGAGVICEIAADDGTMMRLPALREFATEHDLALISIADLISYRHRTEGRFGEVHETNPETTATNRSTEDTEHGVEQAVTTVLPTEYGRFTAVGYRSLSDDTEHVALVCGDIGDGTDILVRVHSECLTGDAFGSLRCDCGPQLRAAMSAVAAEGRGIVLYMRGHEGRGIGLMDKLRAYRLQDTGRDTVDANLDLGLPADARDYGIGARILGDLGVRSMRLLTNNPAKHAGLEGHGITVTGRVKLPTTVRPENLSYLRAKRDRMGHLLEDLPVEAVA